MSGEVSPKDPLLIRLRRYAEQNKSEPWLPVKAPELLALVECAEASIEWRDALTVTEDEAAQRRLFASMRAVEAL